MVTFTELCSYLYYNEGGDHYMLEDRKKNDDKATKL